MGKVKDYFLHDKKEQSNDELLDEIYAEQDFLKAENQFMLKQCSRYVDSMYNYFNNALNEDLVLGKSEILYLLKLTEFLRNEINSEKKWE